MGGVCDKSQEATGSVVQLLNTSTGKEEIFMVRWKNLHPNTFFRRFYALTPKISKENSQWDIRKQISLHEPTHFLISIGSLSEPKSLCKDHRHLPPTVFVHTDCKYDSASVGTSLRASFQAPEP